jgi:hypothetical protein
MITTLPACHQDSPQHAAYVARVEELEAEGCDTSDAQGIADMEFDGLLTQTKKSTKPNHIMKKMTSKNDFHTFPTPKGIFVSIHQENELREDFGPFHTQREANAAAYKEWRRQHPLPPKKTAVKIIFVPLDGHRTIEGRARAIEKSATRQWRKQISDWFETVPGTDSAIVEFSDNTTKFYQRTK